MTTVVQSFTMDSGRIGDEYYMAPTLVLSERASIRVCLAPAMATALAAKLARGLTWPTAPTAPAAPAKRARGPRPDRVRVSKKSQSQIIASETAEAFELLEADPRYTITACAARYGLTHAALIYRLRTIDEPRYDALPQRAGKGGQR